MVFAINCDINKLAYDYMVEENETKKQKINAYLKYSGLAFQMLGLIFLGLVVGQWLDKKFSLTTMTY